MRVAVIGSRGFPELYRVREYVKDLPADTVVISGGAHGVDQEAADAASDYGFTVEVHYPNYHAHGIAATHIRNHDIIKGSDKVVAFWDGKSPGTDNVIRRARALGKPTIVFYPLARYEQEAVVA